MENTSRLSTHYGAIRISKRQSFTKHSLSHLAEFLSAPAEVCLFMRTDQREQPSPTLLPVRNQISGGVESLAELKQKQRDQTENGKFKNYDT